MKSALRLLVAMCLVLVSVSAVAQEMSTEPPPPWEAAEPKPVAVQRTTETLVRPDHLQKYTRYQRIALVGTPFYIAGMSMVGWGGYQIAVEHAGGNLGVALTFGAGTIVAVSGAGAMAWGSHGAAMALHNDEPAPRHVLAGRMAYGMLGIGSTAVIISIFLPAEVGTIGAIGGYGLAIASGIPAAIQMSTNARLSQKQLGPTITMVPMRSGVGVGAFGRF